MDFGKVPYEQLDSLDFSLPPDPGWNKKLLPGKAASNPKVFVGCAKWGRKEWIGKIYPEKTSEAKFLQHYVQHYNSIELNATHYSIYPPSTIKGWAEKAHGRDFIFSPKFPKSISHFGSLVNVDDKTNAFLQGIYEFREHLGPIFLQLSDKFGPSRKTNIYNYLASLPHDLQFFLELRHSDWYADKGTFDELLQKLHDLNVGFIITDAAGRRDCVHMNLTIPKTFIRFVGNSLHASDYTRIDAWVDRIKQWLDNGMQEVYFFMHMHDEATSPELSSYLVTRLNAVCGLSLPDPLFISKV